MGGGEGSGRGFSSRMGVVGGVDIPSVVNGISSKMFEIKNQN